MQSKIIFALVVAAALISLSLVSLHTNPGFVSAQSQNGQGTQHSGINQTQGTGNETMTAGNVTLQLHAQLDAAIIAARNNDTLGVLMGLSQISSGLAEINKPSGDAPGLGATSDPNMVSNQTAGSTAETPR